MLSIIPYSLIAFKPKFHKSPRAIYSDISLNGFISFCKAIFHAETAQSKSAWFCRALFDLYLYV
jgi:hypothetical protein